MHFDVCIWTKNSSHTLARVLDRFQNVVPHELVHEKIAVDEQSSDSTVSILKDYGWSVFQSDTPGIPAAFNEALRHVTTEWYLSIEDDLLLADDWLERLLPWTHGRRNAVIQGVRLPTDRYLRAIEADTLSSAHTNMDNTIYRTRIIRRFGGLQDLCRACMDTWLRRRLEANGYVWVTDCSVVSDHIRSGVRDSMKHLGRWHKRCSCGRLNYEYPATDKRTYVKYALKSPFSGVLLALRLGIPEAVWAYPYVRFKLLQYRLDGTATHKDAPIEITHQGEELTLTPRHLGILASKWEMWSRYFVPKPSLRGKVVIDVGAGEGETAHFFTTHGAKKVICVEPDPGATRLLLLNAKRNSWNLETTENFSLGRFRYHPFQFAKIDVQDLEACLEGVSDETLPCTTIVTAHGSEQARYVQTRFSALVLLRLTHEKVLLLVPKRKAHSLRMQNKTKREVV